MLKKVVQDDLSLLSTEEAVSASAGPQPLQGTEEDRAAIMRIVVEETAAYLAKNFERWKQYWVQGSYGWRWMWFGCSGVTMIEGFEAHGQRMKNAMERAPVPLRIAQEIRRENIILSVGGDMAWLTFDQYAPSGGGDPLDMPALEKQMRILEKHDGEWKIVACANIQRTFDHVRSPLVRLDDQGLVLWMNTAGSAYLRERDPLLLRNGRLHASSRKADERLQAAIRWAVKLREPSRVIVEDGALPVMLGGEKGVPASMCWVIVESEMILVSMNDHEMTEKQLRVAASIYGLSPAQVELAGHIVAGRDLVAAASELGISASTARTQLQRIFEKTGVRSQTALVRALLSFAPQLSLGWQSGPTALSAQP